MSTFVDSNVYRDRGPRRWVWWVMERDGVETWWLTGRAWTRAGACAAVRRAKRHLREVAR